MPDERIRHKVEMIKGRLKDQLSTPTGSRVVQLYNERAEISLVHRGEIVAE